MGATAPGTPGGGLFFSTRHQADHRQSARQTVRHLARSGDTATACLAEQVQIVVDAFADWS